MSAVDYSAQLAALPTLEPGVTIALLKRVWFATPANRRHERTCLLNSIVLVKVDGHSHAKPLSELTLAEVEAAIGAVAPRYVVKYYQAGKPGTQVATFVEFADAEKFADGKRLHAQPAQVKSLEIAR